MITIQPATDEAEFRRCQDILVEVWDLENGGERNIIPTRLFQISDHYGGVVLTAHDQEAGIIGFSWAFPAIDVDGAVFLFSDTLAVFPQYRDRGVGTKLKFAQREWALRHNLSMIRWTYDPLEARNGFLNISRLGSLAHLYARNVYGIGATGPNKGIETDRLTVDWHLKSGRVRRCLQSRPPVTPCPDLPTCITVGSYDGEMVPTDTRLDLQSPELLAPLPVNFQRLKSRDLSLAIQWRHAMRSVCETYFAQGYAIVDFHIEESGEERQGHYRFARDWNSLTHALDEFRPEQSAQVKRSNIPSRQR